MVDKTADNKIKKPTFALMFKKLVSIAMEFEMFNKIISTIRKKSEKEIVLNKVFITNQFYTFDKNSSNRSGVLVSSLISFLVFG